MRDEQKYLAKFLSMKFEHLRAVADPEHHFRLGGGLSTFLKAMNFFCSYIQKFLAISLGGGLPKCLKVMSFFFGQTSKKSQNFPPKIFQIDNFWLSRPKMQWKI